MWDYIRSFFYYSDKELEAQREKELIDLLKTPGDPEPFAADNISDLLRKEMVGFVTEVGEKEGVINDCYHFSLDPSEFVYVNDKVKFTAYESGNELEIKVTNVKKISDSEYATLNGEVDMVVKNITLNNKYNTIAYSGLIVNRKGRVFEVQLGRNKLLSFDLNNVMSEFLPSPGDFVDLDVTAEGSPDALNADVSQLNVVKIRPRSTAQKIGVVTSTDVKFGVIGNFALFNFNVCEPGFNPGIGQQVCATLIRSNCINGYKWRAIQVIPPLDDNSSFSHSKEVKKRLEDEFRNKKGILISLNQKATLKLNEEIEVNIEVSNKSLSDKTVKACPVTVSKQNQVTLTQPTSTIIIKAGEVVCFNFKIIGKFLGKSYEDFIWDFGEFVIRRRILFDVLCENSSLETNTDIFPEKSTWKYISAKDITSKWDGEIMAGKSRREKAFIPVKVAEFRMPRFLVETVLPEKFDREEVRMAVEKQFPCFNAGLNWETYQVYMHALLYLEEIALLRKVALLDMDSATFRRHTDFLILDVPENSFYTEMLLPGDSVLASVPWNPEKKMQGVIHRITKSELWLMFAPSFQENYKEGTYYFVSFSVSRMVLRRQHEAIDGAVKYLGMNWLFPNSAPSVSPQVFIEEFDSDITPFDKSVNSKLSEIVMKESTVRKISRGRGKSLRKQETPWDTAGTGYGRNTVKEFHPEIDPVIVNRIKWCNTSLNKQQKHAVIRILYGVARPLPYVIFGPPGTGKTITVVEAILQVHKHISNSKILVCTPTNSAADLLAERLMESGTLQEGDFLRLVGFSYADQGKLTASLVPYSAVPTFSGKIEDQELIQSFGREQIGQHSIVVATLSCAGILYSMGFRRGFFTHIFVDEAGQATEPELLVPLSLFAPRTGHVILSGDPLQLGPVVTSRLAEAYGLKDSYLVRILNRFPYIKDPVGFADNYGFDSRLVTKLVNNYRSLDGILQVYNSLFYEGDLVAQLSSETSEEAHLLSTLKSLNLQCPVIFHGLRGSCRQERDNMSLYNPQELFQTFSYLSKLYIDGVNPEQIGIITPYRLQAKKIRDFLESNLLEAPKIGSVEEFQGQERMIIILSMVRSSDDQEDLLNSRFVTDSRRINVAISRAQALLIIIGDPEFLDENRVWHQIIKYCVINSSYLGCQLPERLQKYQK